MRIRRWLAPSLLLGAIASCVDAEVDVAASEAAHTTGNYAWSNRELQWLDSTYEELRTNRDTLPDDHPLTRRIQEWADRIDRIVRANAERQLDGAFVAPRPRVKIAPDAFDFNAWVSPLSGCGGGTIQPDLGTGFASLAEHVDDDDATDVALLTPTAIELGRPKLLHRHGWPRGSAFAAAVNQSALPCKLSGTDRRFGSTCTPRPAAHVALTATSPWIHVTTALLAGLEETSVVFLLAHELGHYYRAHPSPLNKHEYRFWYEADLAPRRPVPSAQAKELEAAYVAVTTDAKPIGGPALPSRYSPRLRGFVVDLATKLASEPSTSPPCRLASDLARGDWTAAFATQAPPPAARERYVAFEAAAAGCPPLATLLDAADADARALDAKQQELAQRLRDNRIGLYTHEQEADEIALEIMTKLGIGVDEALAAWIDGVLAMDAHADEVFGPGSAKKAASEHGTLDGAACAALAKNGFMVRGPNGLEPAFVSLGDLGDAHHADCYRIFNLTREARVHRYVIDEAAPPLDPPWSELRAQARALSL